MPFCPECLSEYRRGFESCAHCGITLVEEMPEAPKETSLEGAQLYIEARTQAVLTVATLEPCREIRDLLMAEQVPCIISEEEESAATDVPAIFQRYRAVVAEEDLPRVHEVLAGRYCDLLQKEGVGGLEDSVLMLEAGADATCPACGTSFKVDGDECPECGLYIGA